MKIVTLFPVVLLFLFLSSCSTVTVREDIASREDLSRYKTYSWAAVDGEGGAVRTVNPEVEKLVIGSVDRYMENKGIRKVSAEEADCLLSWFGKVDEKVSTQSVAHFYGPYGYGPIAAQHPVMLEEGAAQRSWREGTLILDIIDRKSGTIVWRGSAADSLADNMSEADAAAYIQRSVRALLDKLFGN